MLWMHVSIASLIFAITVFCDVCIKKSINNEYADVSYEINETFVEGDILHICNKTYSECECRKEILDCRGWHFFQLTHTRLNISGNDILKIAIFSNNYISILKKGEILNGMEAEIEDLDFSDNVIHSIEKNVFEKFNSLKKLNLRNNYITDINNNIFTENLGSVLFQLDLSDNCLVNMSSSDFQYLKVLSWLSLSFNVRINLSVKKNESVSSIFSSALSNLKVLKLESCEIQSLDENVFINLRNLEELHMNNNPLTSVPKEVSRLSKLIVLDLSNTKFKVIEDCDFCNLEKLEDINLSNTGIYKIHENAFGGVTMDSIAKIKNFSIENCKIEIIPERLLDWKNIKHLEIFANYLVCNCSMKWIIDNMNSTIPLINRKNESYGEKLICFNPPNLLGKYLHRLSKKICQNPPMNNFYWLKIFLFVLFIVAVFIFIFYFWKKHSYGIRKFVNFNHLEDKDKLQEDFDMTSV